MWRTCSRRGFVAAAAALTLAAAPLVAAPWPLQAHATEATQAALNDAEARYYAALEQIDYLNNLVFDAEAVYDQISTDLYYTIQRI